MNLCRRTIAPCSCHGIVVFALIACLSGLFDRPLRAATFYWDTDTSTAGNNADGTGLGGTGTWNTSTTNWWDTTNLVLWPNTNVDAAVFSGPFSIIPTLNTVTLISGVTANQLRFERSGYTLTGGDLTLAGTTPTLYVYMGETATISSQILGSAGLTKTGGGSIRLGNSSNSYTGTTTISDGTLIIDNNGALGTDSSTVIVAGTTGGGSLLLAGGYGSGFTLARDVSISGGSGSGGTLQSVNGGVLVSVGDNTLSGQLTTITAPNSTYTGLTSAFGMLTLGNVATGGTAVTNFTTFGSNGSIGNYAITGVLSGTGGIQKAGGGTLLLTPSSSSGFAGTLRIVLGSVRISSGAVLGTHTGTTTSSTVELNGGTLEVRSDAATTAIGKNVYMSNGSALFVDHAVGGSAINGTVTFGAFSFLDNENLAINGRNGYNVTLGAAQITGTVDGPTTFTNSLSGLLTIGGNLWNYTEGDTARAFTMAGAGNTLVTGNILASGNTHSLVKTGAGTLTLTGTASTYTGATSVNGGTLAINDFRAITNNTATINIGANGTGLAAGILAIIGNNMTLANLTTSKVINLGGTTNGATILANQTGTSPGVVFNAAFTATGAGIKTLTLGGANIGANTINGAIVNNSGTNTTALSKIDAGRWILAGTNTYTGATTISNGTLQLKANAASSTILADTSAIVFDATNVYAGGILELIGQASTNNVETLGALTPTNGSGTVRLTPGSGGTASIIFASLGTVGGGGTVNIVAPTSSDTVSFTSITGITAGNIANAGVYYNGSDFAFVPGAATALRAPIYGTDADFATSATALTAGQNNEITGSFSNGALAIDSLKINGAHTLTLTGALTIRTGAVAAASGGIIQTGGSGTITGAFGVGTNGAGTLVINVDGGANSLSIDSNIVGTGGFTKVGAGTLRLGGTNAQTGTISINEGTVRLAGADRLGAAAALTIRQDGILELNGVTPATNTNAFNNNGLVRNTSATTDVIFTVGGANGTGTSLGIIEDGGVGKISVIKIGTGAQSWLGLSTYTGATTIGSTGIVTINNLADGGFASGIGASSNAAGNLIFNGASPTQAYGGLSYTGTSTISIDRLFTFGGTAANSGARIQANGVNHAAIIWSNTSALAFGTVDIAQGLVLGGASLGDNRFNPLITDNGTGKVSLFKADAGLWILGNSANSYTGATTITNGFLDAQDGITLPNASGLILGGTTTGGVLETSGDFTRNIVASGSAGTNTVSWNSTVTTGANGFSASSSKLRVAFGGIGAETTLTWGGGGFGIGTGALIFNSTTALSEVEFRNAIDLNGATRTFQVNDNTNTFTDFATISGVISGTGGISKTGAGLLQLVGANTYSGTTAVTAGTLVVNTLGNSAVAGGSGVGTNTNANLAGNAVILGNGGTGAGILNYVGDGEVSDRAIHFNTTTGDPQIIADGSGPLVLTNVLTNTGIAGAGKVLFLRGANSLGNMITSNLTDDSGANAVAVTHDSAGTWILTGNNTYTGTTTASGGALGAGSDTAFGAGSLTILNATIFAYGADRTFSLAVSEANSTGAVATFAGDYSLTFDGAWTNPTTSATGRFTRNNIISGKTLTINGAYTFTSVDASIRNWNFDGSGDTIINGLMSNTQGTIGITYVGTGSLTLGGANTYNGATNVSNGVLKLGASGVLPDGVGKGNVAINPAVGVTATLDLNGKSETINGLTSNGAGTAIIDNTSGTAASLTFGANDQVVNIGGLGNYTITDSGAGALSITKTGTGSASILTGVVLTYQGSTNVNGGSMTVASAVNGTTGISVTNSGSALVLSGGLTTPSAITSVVVENGGTLSLLDGAGNKLNGLTTLQLGSSGGTMTTLNLNVGDLTVGGDELNTDTFTLLTGGTLSLFAGNQITFNLTDTGLNAGQTYELLNFVDGGFTSGPLANTDYILGATPGGFSSITLTANNNSVFITTGTLITGKSWWNAGGTLDNWNDVANWSVDLTPPTPSGGKAGTNPAVSSPGQGTDVIFIADNIVGGAAITTTLEQNFKINSLTFEASTNPADTPVSVTIAPGVITTNRIEIAPQLATDGIKITAGGPATATISGPVRLGGLATSQTWDVADAGSILSLGSLQGERDVTKSGLGKVTLSAAADATFNSGVTADFTTNAGTLEILDSAALGNTINANLATVTINNTGAFFYNGVTGTVANNLTLNGGSLSVGTATQTYSGTVNVSGNSFINLRDSNSAVTTTVSRSIVLTGVISGSGRLTISSDETVANLVGGNAEVGTLTINNLANTWNGELAFQSGSVDFTSTPTSAANAGHTGAVTFNQFGRLIYRNINGQTLNRTGALTFAAGAIGEIYVDNISAVLGADYVINQNGVTTLGSGGTGASARFTIADVASTLNIAGGVVLGGNSSISVDGGDADSLVIISSIISDGGSGYSLAINDDAGGWGVSNDIIRLTGASTFTGNVTLASGTLQFDTVTGISGAASSLGQGTAIDVSGSATLSFIGTSAQSTDRPINSSNAAGILTLSANGTGVGTKITYSGAINITNTADGSNIVLTGTAGSEGVISGGITETADTADMTVNGGNWTIDTATSRIGDDMVVSGADTILNLNSGLFQVRDDFTVTAGANLNLNGTGVLSFNIATLSADSSLRATGGGIITLGADDAVVATQFDGLRIGVDATGVGTLNMGAFNQTVAEFILGNRNIDRTGFVSGTGILTVTANFDVYAGTIFANLASTGSTVFEKIGAGTVTLLGNNSGLASTGATIVYDGILALDYTADNSTKLRAASALDLRGARLNVIGNNSAATTQTVGGLTLATGGSSTIQVTGGTGQEAVLNLGAITRGNSAQDGTIRFILPSGTQSATNGITTTSPNSTFGMLGTGATATSDAAYATVQDGTGTWFATASGGNIVALASTPKNDVTTWALGDHITDETTGFTGTLQSAFISSLRFNTAGGSDVVMSNTGVLIIGSGGFLITSNVGGTPSMMDGTLASGATELVITQDSTQPFEIGSDIRINQGVTKTGAGTLLLSGNNVYTGATEIQEGTLQVSGNSIGDTSLVSLSASRPTTLELLANEAIGRLSGGQRATDGEYGTVAVGSHTLTINNSGSNTTYAGFFTGDGHIVKQGTHNLALSNISSGFIGVLTVESGLVTLNNVGQINASTIRVNKGGSLDFNNTGSTRSGTRILDTTSIVLNSADGTFQGQTIVRGLMIRTDQNANTSETIGNLIFNTGTSYISGEGDVGTGTAISFIIAHDFVRLNNAVVVARGRALGAGSGERNQFKIGTAGNETTLIGTLIGGNGLAGSQNINILRWGIGAVNSGTNGALVDGDMGNSFLTYSAGTGLRPLDFATEYDTIALAAATDNARESLASDLTGLVGTTVNSLIIDNAAFTGLDVTGTGAGQTLAVTSGSLLFTVSGGVASTAYDTTLGGFDSGITVGGTNEYVISVVNPSSAATTSTLTATISSNLTSAADITKSGRGSLVLSGTNTAGGGSNKTTLNEGTLEIADLDNIGGNTGSLVFAGGTLRLGAGLTDDISLRTISLLDGGGTIDTNGIDLALANSVGTGLGGLTKIGLGNLTLNAAASYTGATTITSGTLTIGASNATGNGGALNIGAGATLALGANSITASLVSTSGASPAITGAGTINASTGFLFSNTGDITVDAILAGSGGLFKNQTNVLTLTGLSTYAGTTEIQSGTLSVNSISNVGGGASALGNAANAENGSIRMGLTTTATTLQYTGTGHTCDRLIGMQGTTGGVTIDADGTGALGLGGARFEMAGNKTLTLRGSSNPLTIDNSIGAITEIGGVLTLNKADGNTWLLTAANTYTGVTQIDDGTLMIGVSNALPTGTTVRLGTGTTAGTFDLNGFNQTITALLVQTNSGSVTNQIVVDAGMTLTVNGAVTIGANANDSITNLTATGGGSFVNNNDGGTFQVGGATTTNNENTATVDFSGLGSFNANLGAAGIFRIGDNSATTTATGPSTMTLATDNTITAGVIQIGATQTNTNQQLRLGAGTNLLNADLFTIGGVLRSSGTLDFASATGTVVLRASDGTSRTDVNVAASTASTANSYTGTVDLTGHSADLLIDDMNMAVRTQNTGSAAAVVSFDQGTLDVTTLNMASRTGAGTGGATATLNLGDSAAPGTAMTSIITLNMAVNTSAGGTVVADLNVTGGNVSIGDGLNTGTAINMANAGTGRTVTSTIDLTGGTVTVTGNIIRTGGAGTENGTLTLDGSTLNMSGNSIGTGTTAINFVAASGTLKNLGELNGGGGLTKTTGGTLFMDGTNTYTGVTTVSVGTLQFLKQTALYNNTQASWTDTNIVVNSGATAAFNVGGAGEFTSGDVDIIKGLGTGSGGFANGSFIGLDTTNASGGEFAYAGNIADTNSGANSVGLKKLGANTLTLTGANSYTGATTVSGGTLQVGDGTSGTLAGSSGVTVSTGAKLSGSGSVSGSTVIGGDAILAPGVGATDGSNQTLTFTAAGTAVEVQDGGQIQLGLTGSTQIDVGFDWTLGDALTYLDAKGGTSSTEYTTIWSLSGDYDSVKLTNGTFNLGVTDETAGGTIKLLDNGPTSYSAGNIFKLLDWSTVGTADSLLVGSGGFTLSNLNFDSVALGSGLAWDTSAFTTYGVIVVVPEPGRALFLLLGLLGLMLRRRRRCGF